MTEYIDLNTGGELRDEKCAGQAYAAGHRIRMDCDGAQVTEWIPGSNDYYSYEGGKKVLHCWKREERYWTRSRPLLRGLGAGDSRIAPYGERRVRE